MRKTFYAVRHEAEMHAMAGDYGALKTHIDRSRLQSIVHSA